MKLYSTCQSVARVSARISIENSLNGGSSDQKLQRKIKHILCLVQFFLCLACLLPGCPLSTILSCSVCALYPIIHSTILSRTVCASYPIIHSPRFCLVPRAHHTRSSTFHVSLSFRVCIIPDHPLSTIVSYRVRIIPDHPLSTTLVPCVHHTRSSTLHDSVSYRVRIIPDHPLSTILSRTTCASYPIIHFPRFSLVPCVHHTRSSTLHDSLSYRVHIIPDHPFSTTRSPSIISAQQNPYRVSLLSFSNLQLLFPLEAKQSANQQIYNLHYKMNNNLFTAIMFVRTDKHSHGKRVHSHGHKRLSQNVLGVF
jgi:hypothetical protein